MNSLRLGPILEELVIASKDATVEPINLYNPDGKDYAFAWAQRILVKEVEKQYNAGKPVRIIVLKARQLGITTITEAILFAWSFIFPGTNSLVIAHETDTSQSAFEKNVMFWENWPYKDIYKMRSTTQRRMAWEHGSAIRIATARNVKSGRGRTLQALHATECAFWDDPETLMTGLRQTIPNKRGSLVILESTANGVGNWFHSTWEDAVSGVNDYIPLFFSWLNHYEYTLPLSTINPLLPDLDTKEIALRKLGASLEHLEWRRFAIPSLCHGDEDYFCQEYPATPEEAFLTTGRNVFPIPKLDLAYQPMRGMRGEIVEVNGRFQFYEDPTGRVTIFRKPSPNLEHGSYMIGGDPSRTTLGDRACIQVLNRNTFEQVAVWHGKIDPVTFADEMAKLGNLYNMATLAPEMEGPGYATIAALIKMNYPNLWKFRRGDRGGVAQIAMNLFGWSTNYQRKHWAIGNVVRLLYDNSLTIHDEETYHQMRNYVVLDNGEMGNARDAWKYDDAVMAFVISVICTLTEGPVHIVEPGPLGRYDIGGVPDWNAFPGDDTLPFGA